MSSTPTSKISNILHQKIHTCQLSPSHIMHNSEKTRLGLCCLTHGDSNKTKFKTVRKGWAEENPSLVNDRLIETWSNNLRELAKVLNFCMTHNIWCYRISSDMFPLADLHPYSLVWNEWKQTNTLDWELARDTIVKFISLNGRLSTHPGQFCVITSDRPEVVERSMLNLVLHGDFFDALYIPRSYNHPINIHLSNGKAGERGADNARRVMDTMPPSLINRLVFETEDKNFWTWQRIMKYFPDVPVTLDYHHRNINNLGESEDEAHHACVSTWKQTLTTSKGAVCVAPIKPLFHYTEGARHSLDRSHADMITKLPVYRDVDLEIEAKHKEVAILHAMQWL